MAKFKYTILVDDSKAPNKYSRRRFLAFYPDRKEAEQVAMELTERYAPRVRFAVAAVREEF